MSSATRSTFRNRRGLTLIEVTIVLMILMTLVGSALVINRRFGDWKRGREASETLRTVYSAQRMFLSDNPTVQVNTITAAQLLPYMPGRPAAMPTVKSLTGANLGILVNVSPPAVNNGGGIAYDPSPNRTDNLWDVGE